MELVVKVATGEALAAALEMGVAAVAVRLPRAPGAGWWEAAAAWRREARRQGTRFYLVWDWLVRERELPQAAALLAAAAQMDPEALVLRDLGLWREARQRYGELPLHGAAGLGLHNSPGLGQARRLGFQRVVVSAPLALKDLALMRREAAIALEVSLPPGCRGFAGLCLLPDYLGIDCPACGAWEGGSWLEALETLPGLAQLGVEAVQVGGEFSQAEVLRRVVPLFQAVLKASPEARPRALAAAREVWEALGPGRERGKGTGAAMPGKYPRRGRPREAPLPRPLPASLGGRGRVWLEARGYPEAAALARQWRGPLVVQLTPENWAAFLAEHRRWQPRRLVFRLPALLRETALPFYRQALETLRQGGYSRFMAGDWGGVALAQAVGGEVFGDQTLGVRNSWALKTARELGVARICLLPGAGPGEAREILRQAPPGSFWGYFYHFPALAVCPREEAAELSRRLPKGKGRRWVAEGDLALLCPEAAEQLNDAELRQQAAPLVVALTRSGLPWGRVPPWAGGPRERQQPGV